jgi:CheY-like chemotaxis protein
MTAGMLTPGAHSVQFYEGDRWLYHAVFEFFADALRTGSHALMVARRGTYDAVLERLVSSADPALAGATSRLHFADAEATLDGFMIDGTPDGDRFARLFHRAIDKVRQGRDVGPIWIYGEMVDVLCRLGRHDAAIALEALWNRMMSPEYVVLCGYAIASFDDDVRGTQFRAVCQAHSHIIPAENWTSRGHAAAAKPAAVSVVYVIDDDASMRRSLARLLESVDLTVKTYPSAEAFLDEVDRTARGCLILDIQLAGGMSGTDLQSLMTVEEWPLPIIAMSGLHDDRMEAEALRQGAQAFLHKPFDPDALLDAIARAQH